MEFIDKLPFVVMLVIIVCIVIVIFFANKEAKEKKIAEKERVREYTETISLGEQNMKKTKKRLDITKAGNFLESYNSILKAKESFEGFEEYLHYSLERQAILVTTLDTAYVYSNMFNVPMPDWMNKEKGGGDYKKLEYIFLKYIKDNPDNKNELTSEIMLLSWFKTFGKAYFSDDNTDSRINQLLSRSTKIRNVDYSADISMMGHEYFKDCENSLDRFSSNVMKLGYILGTLDTAFTNYEVFNTPYPNIPDGVTPLELYRVVMEYINDNLNEPSETTSKLIYVALLEKYGKK